MMPALLISTLSRGCWAIRRAAAAARLSGSVMSSSIAPMPRLAATTASRWSRRRPEMITSLPSLCSASARPRPIPEPPPVMKMVLPVSFIGVSFEAGEQRSGGEAIAEHRQAADGLGLRRLVLDDVPVFGELAVLEADDIGGDPRRREAVAGEPAVCDHPVAVGD